MRLLVLLLAGLLTSTAFAADDDEPHRNERDYIIEILIFAQKPGSTATELPGKPHVFLPIEVPALKVGPAPVWTQLSTLIGPIYKSQTLQLAKEAAALERNKDYRLLFHEAWQMRLVSEEKSLPLLVEGGDYFGGKPELQGILKLSVARYLHLETDLFLNTFEPHEDSTYDTAQQLLQADPESLVIREGSSLIEGVYQVKDSAGMHQRRRMRSGDLHFIDSPYLGLLIKIDRAP